MMLVGITGKVDGYHNKRDVPKKGMGIEYLIRCLELVRTELRTKEIMNDSPYKFKNGTYNALKWCVEKGLVSRREYWGDDRGSRRSSKPWKKPYIFYKITDKGEKLLEMIG